MVDAGSSQPQNLVLSGLPRADFDAIAPEITTVHLTPRAVLYDVAQDISYIYFPETCVASVVGITSEGNAVEVATVGNEGLIGLPVFLGATSTPGQAMCQVPGRALRLPSNVFREVSSGGAFHQILLRYTQAMFTQISQSSVCNRMHVVEERCARWLLMTHDRVQQDEFDLTQEFLSQMLGVRRATVSETASKLQDSGFISYSRGHMRILDRAGLERAACECYGVIREDFERLLNFKFKGSAGPRAIVPQVSEGGTSTAGDGTPRRASED